MPNEIGSRIYHQVVDEIAHQHPNKVYASIPTRNWAEDGWQDITYAQVSRGIDWLSWWLDEHFGKASAFDTLAYAGPNDLRFAIVVGACSKTQRTVLFPDVALAEGALAALLRQSNCHTILAVEGSHDWQLRAAMDEGATLCNIPPLDACLNSPLGGEKYPYSKSFQEAKEDPLWILHTSGTTGTPKQIVYKHSSFTCTDKFQLLSLEAAANTWITLMQRKRALTSVPLYWSVGTYAVTLWAAFWDIVPVLLPEDAPAPVTGEYIDKIHDILTSIGHQSIQTGYYTPSVLTGLLKLPHAEAALDRLGKLESMWYGGAALERWAGDVLTKHVQLVPSLGSAEMGPLPTYVVEEKEDWMYFHFHPACGTKMDESKDIPDDADKGLRELILVRNDMEDPNTITLKPFQGDSQLRAFRTSDLYEQHPERQALWQPAGRADDFVKLSWMEKFHARDVEKEVEQMQEVKGVFMGGVGRDRPFMIIEVQGINGHSSEESKERIWKAIEEINKTTAKQIEIKRDLVLFLDDPTALPRLGKGTVNRRKAVEMYQSDIDNMYDRLADVVKA